MVPSFKVKDLSLASRGRLLIEWAEAHMPVLMKIRQRFQEEKPLEGIQISACLHVTKETAVLVKTLMAGGAKVALAASNPLSTQDEVAAALAEEDVNVYAWRGETRGEYYWALNQVASYKPHITVDDGADLISLLHSERKDLLEQVVGGTEETTTGVLRIKSLADSGVLRYPVIAVNNAQTKWDFDNIYGTGQSTIDGILRSTNVLLAGKRFVVAGYGHCGRGIAWRARGMGAHVIITEVDPIQALRAVMDGFEVMPMSKAAELGDILVTATGCKDVIRREHMEKMKDGAILANAGHFNVEISIPDLEALAVEKRVLRENVEEYRLKDGRKLYLLAEGRLVNLAAAEGHPSEVMDMSFANQALSIEYLVKNQGKLPAKVYDVPYEIDSMVARLKLETLGIQIDILTPEQERYLKDWREGT
ncbi:MAG: adenosylhomocysteinase [Candidatus Verstraetearchaeota archaeon]|nr:adenosylhomocysteinase [Candidatus Verstraetearchaeota archaeon]